MFRAMRLPLTLGEYRPSQRWSLIWLTQPVPGLRYLPFTAWKGVAEAGLLGFGLGSGSTPAMPRSMRSAALWRISSLTWA